MVQQISWKIGGQQGEGIESAGELLAIGLNQLGYYLYGYRVFSSRIRGGHTNYNIRVSTMPIASVADGIDVLIALDQETIALCAREVHNGGLILADSSFSPVLPEALQVSLVSVPLAELAAKAGSAKMKNVAALGMTAAMLGLAATKWEKPLHEEFAPKGDKLLQENLAALQNGWDYAMTADFAGRWKMEAGDGIPRLYVIGNETISRGAVAAGAKFMAAYPITPASEIMESMVQRLPELGGRMVQTEDEIAACMMAIGANYAGVRAFTATSGPGLSLMAESIGLAAMTETPLVVIDVQRGGPSTGLPTKHEQSDVMAALFSTHGEAPKIVLAPDSIAAAYHDTIEAFNLAEEFQCPVILLSDMQLSLGVQTIAALPEEPPRLRRGKLMPADSLPELPKNQYFKRYQVTPDGISPRVIPGTKNGMHHSTGLEHDETGRPFEGTANRIAQTDKRQRKLATVVEQFFHPVKSDTPYEEADLLVIGAGASSGPMTEAVARLRQDGIRVNQAVIRLLQPFPTDLLETEMGKAKQIVVVEHNATAQLAALIRMRTTVGKPVHSVLKYDGNPFRPAEIDAGCREVL